MSDYKLHELLRETRNGVKMPAQAEPGCVPLPLDLIERLITLLEEIEWHCCPDNYWAICVHCKAEQPAPHADDCELAALLQELRSLRAEAQR